MKVSGPNSGPGAGAAEAAAGAGPDEAAGPVDGAPKSGSTAGIGATDATGAVERTEGTGRAFAEKLAAAGTPAAADAPGAAAQPAELHATAGIAADLEAGRLTPAAAVDKVLEQVLATQVGADAPAAVRERVRAALQDALENDPLLADKLRRLSA